MSSTPNSRATAGQARPPAQSAGSNAAAAFDPMKLLQKYKFVLVGAVILGAILGYVANFLFGRFMPGYTSTVLFVCTPVQTDMTTLGTPTIDEDEMSRFIGTQVEALRGERILNEVLRDPRLQAEAPNWYSKFVKNGSFDIIKAYDAMENIVKANAINQSYWIELAVTVGKKEDAAGLVRLVKENYLESVTQNTSSDATKMKQSIRDAIASADATVLDLSARKNRILTEQGLISISVDNSAEAGKIQLIDAQILNLQQQIEAYQVILADDEAQLQKDTPIVFDNLLRQQVEQNPQILSLKQRIVDYNANLISLEQEGIGRGHRTYKQVVNLLDATKRQLDTTREELLLQAFEARIDATRMTLSQLRAQIAELSSEKEIITLRLNELTQLSEEIEDINRQIESTLELKSAHNSDLAELTKTSALETAKRISVYKPETVPDSRSFPQLIVMLPAGVFLTTMLVAGLIVGYEAMDQRVKSAADIAMIPRTSVLGIIPDAEEDPTKHESLQTVFRDSPNSVLAEHYRQLRTKITKKMAAHEHKTLLVVGAMPGSGATSVTTNLGLACISAGKKVLIIDTNFRRARIHNAFGLQESPGLAEVLAGDKSLSEAITTLDNGLSILPAGARNQRVVERLGTDKFGQILAESGAQYDVVLLDVAPAIVAGDAHTLANHVDATILVARALQEKRGQVARLKNELSDTRAELLGVLVNGVKSAAGGYMRKNIRTSHMYHTEESPQAV